jgi:hypothetical protein
MDIEVPLGIVIAVPVAFVALVVAQSLARRARSVGPASS